MTGKTLSPFLILSLFILAFLSADSRPFPIRQVVEAVYQDTTPDCFLVISDVHRHRSPNLFPLDAKGDTSPEQWDTAKSKIDAVLSGTMAFGKPRFMVYLGDLPWHAWSVSKDEVQDAMYSAADVLKDLRERAEAAGIPLIYVPGNNDSESGDYRPFSPSLLERDCRRWPVINGADKTHAAANPYLGDTSSWRSGYYSAYPLGRIPNKKNLKMIILNTTMFHEEYEYPVYPKNLQAKKDSGRQAKDVGRQMNWLNNQLKEAAGKNEPVLIALHIPPGKDGYRSEITQPFSDLWDPRLRYTIGDDTVTAQNVFLDLMRAYNKTIAGVLSSHTHLDGIRLIKNRADDSVTALLISVPAINTGHGNNAAMKVINYNPANYQLEDFLTLYQTRSERLTGNWGNSYYTFRDSFHCSKNISMIAHLRELQPAMVATYVNSIYTAGNGLVTGDRNSIPVTIDVRYQP